MAYIIAVIPGMLSKGGLPFDSALTVTILMTIITTVAMALYTNRPFVLALGLFIALPAFKHAGIIVANAKKTS